MYQPVYVDDMNFPCLHLVLITGTEEVDKTLPGKALIGHLSVESFMKHGDILSLVLFPALYVRE